MKYTILTITLAAICAVATTASAQTYEEKLAAGAEETELMGGENDNEISPIWEISADGARNEST